MERPFAVIGDTTTHGGRVIEGAPTTDINGVRIARIGDRVICPRCGHDTHIVTGDLGCVIEGSPAARHGDSTSCGATLISTQFLTSD